MIGFIGTSESNTMSSSGIMPRAMARIPAETEMRNNLEVDDKIVVNGGGKKDGSKRFSLYDDSFTYSRRLIDY